MAELKINPTRTELLKLKKRTALAKRGHKLLKDKRDGLMSDFIQLIKEAKEQRRKVDSMLEGAFTSLAIARASLPTGIFESILTASEGEQLLEVSKRNVMNVAVPQFRAVDRKTETRYGAVGVPSEVSKAVRDFEEVMAEALKLAETEKTIKLLSSEIESTRRRVNALEHILIPRFDETIKRIRMRLDEMERSSFSNLLKIKSILQA
jgi:V/A-type H+-transporting ATPase subunit D